MVVGEAADTQSLSLVEVLDYALFKRNLGAPLKQALSDAKIGKAIFIFLWGRNQTDLFLHRGKGSQLKPEKEEFVKVIRDTPHKDHGGRYRQERQ